MDGKWIGFILAGGLLNGFAMLISSVAYTAWSIRMRHRGYYFLFRREINLRKAEDAEEFAEGVVKWLRPLCLVAGKCGLGVPRGPDGENAVRTVVLMGAVQRPPRPSWA